MYHVFDRGTLVKPKAATLGVLRHVITCFALVMLGNEPLLSSSRRPF